MKAAELNGARAGFCCRGGAVGAMKAAELNGARAGFCCRSGAVGAMKAAELNGARAGFCCRGGAVGAMKAAELNGARAGFCCRGGAGGTAAAEAATGAAVETAGGDEVRGGCVDGDPKGSPFMPATRAACLRFRSAISSSIVCCWAVMSWERVQNSRALPSCISAVWRAAAAEESCVSCSRRAAVPEQERKSAR